jgi:serine/threonine protein kinase
MPAVGESREPGLGLQATPALPVDDTIADDVIAMFRAAAERRYAAGERIGVGGMGEVRAAADRATGRVVAVKTVRADQVGPQALRRFAREARIQAQLEHPAIVPVYDVGIDDTGELYFTMKHIRGDSLADVIEKLRARDPEAMARYSRRRLLTVLSQVALAVAYAHRRGVLHRDLKPSNVMLGSFGEVYVLDWGLAEVRGGGEPVRASLPLIARLAELDGPVVDSSVQPDTASGQLLGTPGYAPPELIEQGSAVLDERGDVYALGSMIYEVLTLERMHGHGNLGQLLGATLELDGARPSQRAADVPPELDALCFDATRRDPAARLASASALARRIDAYLDGDRDVAERHRLADTHTTAALAAVDTNRAAALRDVVTALGLEPGHTQARQTLVRLLTEPDARDQAAADTAHADEALRAFRLAARNTILALLTYLLYVPLVLWMGVRSWPMLGIMAAAISSVVVATAWYHQHPPAGLKLPWPHLVLSLVALSTGVFVAGPLVLLPTVAVATGVGYISAFERRITVTIVSMVLVVMVPFALQLAGVLPNTYEFSRDAIIVHPGMTHLPRAATITFLAVTHTVVLVAALLFAWRLREAAVLADRKLRLQAWQLAQLAR